MRKIVAAVDGSDFADRALRVAAQLAAELRAELSILTGLEVVIDSDLAKCLRSERISASEIVERRALTLLAAAKKAASEFGAKQIETVKLWGDPATTILEYVKSELPDLLVMGRRGKGRLPGLLLGSVSQKVVNLAGCPVMVVP